MIASKAKQKAMRRINGEEVSETESDCKFKIYLKRFMYIVESLLSQLENSQRIENSLIHQFEQEMNENELSQSTRELCRAIKDENDKSLFKLANSEIEKTLNFNLNNDKE